MAHLCLERKYKTSTHFIMPSLISSPVLWSKNHASHRLNLCCWITVQCWAQTLVLSYGTLLHNSFPRTSFTNKFTFKRLFKQNKERYSFQCCPHNCPCKELAKENCMSNKFGSNILYSYLKISNYKKKLKIQWLSLHFCGFACSLSET